MTQPKKTRIAIIGGGIAGVTAAWQLARLQPTADVTLFESSPRLGGIVETVRDQGFTIECGPDAWVTEKPWARELAEELGLADEIISSNDATRKTYILKDGQLAAMPDGMRMMVPADLAAVDASPLFSIKAKQAFHSEISRAAELKAAAPAEDESVASFVRRHFGDEVLQTVGAPLLSGVFGGDVSTLSVRAVMAPFVALEHEQGSLITALRARMKGSGNVPVFTTLRTGLGTLIDTMIEQIPPAWIRRKHPVAALERTSAGWTIHTPQNSQSFDQLLMAAPAHVARELLCPIDADAANLMRMDASSAVVVAFAYNERFALPQGFGFLVPPTGDEENSLLAATFVDQKFDCRVPAGGRLLRAFFGGATGARLLGVADEVVIQLARTQLEAILGKLPGTVLTVVRRWPHSLPQYSVGHLDRMAELEARVKRIGDLSLLGNGYRGVGLPDLIRDSRAAAHNCLI
jgi:oxygen-dependent protoporphyrinogen oxidase